MDGWEAGSPASCFLFPLPPIILSLKKKKNYPNTKQRTFYSKGVMATLQVLILLTNLVCGLASEVFPFVCLCSGHSNQTTGKQTHCL